MQKMNWLESHLGSLDMAIESANDLYWNMRLEERENKWFIWAGDQILFMTDNHESLDAFLYGLALAYSILPEPAFEIIKKEVRKLIGEELVEEIEQNDNSIKS